MIRGLRSRARFERDKMRLELISRIGGTRTRLMFSGLVTRENSGKIREINGTRRDYSEPFGKVSSSTEFGDFSQKTSINNTTRYFSWLVPYVTNFGTNSVLVPVPKFRRITQVFIRLWPTLFCSLFLHL